METQVQLIDQVTAAKQLIQKIIEDEPLSKTQLFFNAQVLDVYNESDYFKIIRTDTSGRLSKAGGGWSLDFGISGEDDQFIHTSIEYFAQRVPLTDHDHWLSYLVSLPFSNNFIKGLLRPGCFDDGPMRKW